MRTAEVVLIGALVPWVRNRDVAGSSEKGVRRIRSRQVLRLSLFIQIFT